MSNPLATNAFTFTTNTRVRSLHVDTNDIPVNKQVARSYQEYDGVGGETITYDGSNEMIIRADNLTSPLTISFGGTAEALRNWIGRELVINVAGATEENITLNSLPALMFINGTNLRQSSHVIVGNAKSKTLRVNFHTATRVNVDYGADTLSINPTPIVTPHVFTFTSTAFDRTESVNATFYSFGDLHVMSIEGEAFSSTGNTGMIINDVGTIIPASLRPSSTINFRQTFSVGNVYYNLLGQILSNGRLTFFPSDDTTVPEFNTADKTFPVVADGSSFTIRTNCVTYSTEY